MLIVGCDFQPSWQEIAVFDTETGEVCEDKLRNGDGEAERFDRQLPAPAVIGVEASGNSQWFAALTTPSLLSTGTHLFTSGTS